MVFSAYNKKIKYTIVYCTDYELWIKDNIIQYKTEQIYLL